jgi:energy-converting hydrogenase Eha subunit A
MGPISWFAVVIAAGLSAAVLRQFGAKASIGRASIGRASLVYLLQFVSAAMLGHALARIGPEKLAAKPQLYAMQSAGLALAVVVPALWIVSLQSGTPARQTLRDSAAFLLAYLVMGAVFWKIGFM